MRTLSSTVSTQISLSLRKAINLFFSKKNRGGGSEEGGDVVWEVPAERLGRSRPNVIGMMTQDDPRSVLMRGVGVGEGRGGGKGGCGGEGGRRKGGS